MDKRRTYETLIEIAEKDDVKRLRTYLRDIKTEEKMNLHWDMGTYFFFSDVICYMAYTGQINCLRFIFEDDWKSDIEYIWVFVYL